MSLTEFCETRVLPLVLAFTCGVLVMDVAQQHRDVSALDIARRAVAEVEAYREECGPVAPVLALSNGDLDRIAEMRR